MRRLTTQAAVAFVAIAICAAIPSELVQAQPNRPEPEALTLDPATTALLILDLSGRCDEPNQPCNGLVPVISRALPKFRASKVLTIYTISLSGVGTPQGDVWAGFSPRPASEFVTAPDGSDKFAVGEIDRMLRERGITTVIVTGASANNAVLYTVSSGARNYGYEIVVPLDGTVAASDYEYDYTMHQFTVTSGVRERTRFTTLDMIRFGNW
ncbi:MAG: isochorismatase hydrolase [Chloroflexi bacterium]|nr:isochorismatase hydrolase [Chloroflexota bacterium]